MKKFILIAVMMIGMVLTASAKYYVGVTTSTVNLREGASVYCDAISRVPKGGYVFVDTDASFGGFYKVVYVDTDEVGYISSKYVRLVEEVKVDRNGILQVVGQNDYYYNSEVTIKNNTSRTATIKVGSDSYKFRPYETRTITVTPGQHDIMASAPGVLPYVGSDYLKSGYAYSWEFYIRTTRY